MRKRLTRSVATFLALLTLASTTAFAVDTKASDRITLSRAALQTGSNGDLYIYFAVTASGTMDVIGASSIEIQRYNGSYWTSECTLTVKDAPEMQATDAVRHSATILYKPNYSSADYRAIVTVYAQDGSGSSTAQVTT